MRWIFAALLLVSLCGCSGVVSTRPFGEAPLDLTEQADKWTGTWWSSMGVCAITVADATNGVLAVISTTPKGWWRWSNETQRIYVRTGGGWTYASMEGTNAVYTWGKIVNEDGTILWWLPDPAKLKPLVGAGALPGTVEIAYKKKHKRVDPPAQYYTESGEPIYQTTDAPEPQPEGVGSPDSMPTGDTPAQAVDDTYYTVTLGDLEPKHYELITATSNGVMFFWEAPLVMVKQSRRADLRYLRSAQNRWMHQQGK